MIYGRAYRPYVYRTLLPTTTRLLAAAVPDNVRKSVAESARQNEDARNALVKLQWKPEDLVDYAIALTLMYLCLVGFVFALRYLSFGVISAPEAFHSAVPIVALVGLSCMFVYCNYLYDFPTLFLFTLGLGLLVRRKWTLFLAVYALACFNKETTILLTMIFIIHFRKSPLMHRTLLGKLLAAQLVIFAFSRAVLMRAFSDNPGTNLEFHLLDHNIVLLHPYPVSSIINVVVILGLIFHHWYAKPRFLRDALWIAIPLVSLTFLFGFLDELRDYYEVYPVLVLLICYSLAELLGARIGPALESADQKNSGHRPRYRTTRPAPTPYSGSSSRSL